MKLSIIIPAYNVEQYIEKCLNSCLEQDIPTNEYEIIVVNDGSLDASLAIANRIATTTNNITVVSQENGGLSAARNTGLSLAKGEYVWFIDSDDWIESNCLGSLTLLMNGVDVVAISFSRVWSNNNKRILNVYTETANTGKELLKKSFFQPAPFYIMRKEFLNANNLMFMKGVFHEDMEFTPRMIYLADKINTTQKCIYKYLQRENSIMTTPNPKRAFDLIKVSNSLHNFKEQHLTTDYKYIFSNTISLGLNNALSIICKANKTEQNKWLKVLKANKHIVRELIKSNVTKYRVQGYIYKLLPLDWCIKIYNIMQLFNKK